jgi:hypothetical protein
MMEQMRRQKLSQINVEKSEKWEESKKLCVSFIFLFIFVVVVEMELAD